MGRLAHPAAGKVGQQGVGVAVAVTLAEFLRNAVMASFVVMAIGEDKDE